MRLAVVSAAGAGLFLWPFTGAGVPAATFGMSVALVSLLAFGALEAGNRRLDSRQLALLASIAATDAALRATVVIGIGGFSPMFLLILCAGYALGASFGFTCGAGAMLVSAVATGGIGPWLPYQMFAAAWVGALAGLAGAGRSQVPGRRDIVILGTVGLVSGFAYGAVLDLWDWSFYPRTPDVGWFPGMPAGLALAHFGRMYVSTSLAYDAFRAVGNVALVAAFGPAILPALRRFQRRFEVVLEGQPPPPPESRTPAAANRDRAVSRPPSGHD